MEEDFIPLPKRSRSDDDLSENDAKRPRLQHGQPWSIEDQELLFRMRTELRLSYDELAARFGRSPRSVYNCLKKHAIGRVQQGKDITETCYTFQLPEHKIRKQVAHKEKVRLEAQERDRIYSTVKNLSALEIAKIYPEAAKMLHLKLGYLRMKIAGRYSK